MALPDAIAWYCIGAVLRSSVHACIISPISLSSNDPAIYTRTTPFSTSPLTPPPHIPSPPQLALLDLDMAFDAPTFVHGYPPGTASGEAR